MFIAFSLLTYYHYFKRFAIVVHLLFLYNFVPSYAYFSIIFLLVNDYSPYLLSNIFNLFDTLSIGKDYFLEC